jgi:hypothetical protein
MKHTAGFAIAAIILGMGSQARGDDPKFAHSGEEEAKKLEEVKGIEWKAAALAGAILTTGNSKTTSLSAGATASRKQGRSKLAIDAGLAYARSTLLFPNDINGNGTIDNDAEIGEDAQTTTDAWIVKARYDFFFTPRNSVYTSASVSADEPAGKELVAGAQVGYSRLLHKSAKHEVVAEVGYDFSYEDPVVGDGEGIHSGRGFVGWAGKLSGDTAAEASVEVLSNVNKLDNDVDRFEDTRVNGKTKLTTKLWEDLNFGFSFLLKYDNAPSARPPLSLPYADGFVPLAEELDTRTEVSLIYNFL